MHWNSSRDQSRAHVTQQAERMALDLGFRSVANLSQILNNFLDRTIPVVAFLDCNILWSNLINETVPTIQGMGYHCHECIATMRVYSNCLIPGTINRTDGTTKAKPNHILENFIGTNKWCTQPKRVFMLQDSPFFHRTYITTA